MSHADIQKVKFSLDRNIGNRVKIRANRGRHKIDEAEGVISETYPSIFLIEVFNKAVFVIFRFLQKILPILVDFY